MPSGVVLLGHGSQDTEGQTELLAYADRLRSRTQLPVTSGVLEYPSPGLPDIQTAFAQASAQGSDRLIGLPALLHFAGHAKADMPAQVQQARQEHPGVDITLAGPLGHDERLLAVIEQRLAAFEVDEDTAVLLVGRGSTDSESNADVFRLARLLWDRNRFGWVEAAFVSLAPPGVAAGIGRCLKLGARRVVVMPYFLCTGVLVKRIAQQALQAGGNVQVAPHLGVHDLVVNVLIDRLSQAQAGMCACLAASGCRLSALRCTRGTLCPA